MNKVEFNDKYELTVNGETLDLETVFCALMRRTQHIDGIGPGSAKHYQTSFAILIDQLESMVEFLETEKAKHRYNGGQR